MVNAELWQTIHAELNSKGVTLIAVSKIKPAEDIKEMYDLGQRDFGENYVQELVDKQAVLPADIRWHFIGHLQSNKVKYIAPFVHLIQGVDGPKLLTEINKQAAKHNRVIEVLLQMHIAEEETKFGMDEAELTETVNNYLTDPEVWQHVKLRGLMGMSTLTDNKEQIKSEFQKLAGVMTTLKNGAMKNNPDFNILSMGMSGDFEMAIEEGSTMVRIGTLLFGKRDWTNAKK
jgi:pyridoxal phosphate enzyme (YggS family)